MAHQVQTDSICTKQLYVVVLSIALYFFYFFHFFLLLNSFCTKFKIAKLDHGLDESPTVMVGETNNKTENSVKKGHTKTQLGFAIFLTLDDALAASVTTKL
jgi:hypothetical protein